jgi:hypothetical protein
MNVILRSLLLLSASAWAQTTTNTSTPAKEGLRYAGGPPDVQGTFVGESFLAFIAPSGFVALQYDPATSGSIRTTYGRFTSWECLEVCVGMVVWWYDGLVRVSQDSTVPADV